MKPRLDRYVNGSPEQGWPRWMLDQLDAAMFVLVVCTETYYRRFRGHEDPSRGRGVDWEGALITQELYDARSNTLKFVPVLFAASNQEFIPEPLRAIGYYALLSEERYTDLLDFLSDVAGVEPRLVGARKPKKRSLGTPLTFGDTKSPSPGPHNLPYPSLGPLFKGRTDFVTRLHEQLGQGKAVGVLATQSIHGLGGVGKTRLAIEYAWQYRDRYSAVLFLPASSEVLLQSSLADLCPLLDLPEHELPDQSVRAHAALRWLEQSTQWLVIFDNVDTEEAAAAVESKLARLHGAVIVTSRLADWSAAIGPLELDVLSEQDAADFLLERTDTRRHPGSNDVELATELAKEVDGLALALEQAGAYVCQKRCSLANYLKRWQAEDAKVRDWFDARLMHYPRSVAVTWETSVEQLDPAARDLLCALAYLAPEPIPEALFSGDAEAGRDQLLSYSLLRQVSQRAIAQQASARDPTGPSYEIHRLVQEVTRQRTPESEQKQWVQRALEFVDNAATGDPEDVRNWGLWLPLQPHAMLIVKTADEQAIADPTIWLMKNFAELLQATNRLSEAEPLMRRALTIAEESYEPDHPTVSIYLGNLAQLLQATNRLIEAEPLMRRALTIVENSYGPEHPKVSRHLNNLAQLLKDTNRLTEAEPLMRRALAIGEESFGPDHSECRHPPHQSLRSCCRTRTV